ncbi:dependent RNA helicase [Seminavis robusta]|uniref:Dependent RNA helicase n=1 Tax=Seminavis robusta TaxID=568900 RepID=A0A9N8DRD2_9STRA|nr:dependent RNA helicase [Seminavis robusta]|eukprot:Sro316_g115490.1 dependent RNA helicase (869) ;mRNA; r:23815-26877
MADLLPSIDSDEDVNAEGSSNDEENEAGDDMDPSFEFGGILGEDGDAVTLSISPGTPGWSFQTALNSITKNQSQSAAPPRMDIASIIAAKRKVLKEEKNTNADLEKEADKEDGDDESGEDSKGSNGDDDDDDNNSESSTGGSNSINDDDSSESEDEEEEDDKAHKMEKDVLTSRAGNDDDDDDDDEPDDDDEDDKDLSSDEEDVEEAKKAEKFFDSQSTLNGPGEAVELFVQLTLSRPLLRGVAAMGFVKPTPIQAACIPAALSGRDICASAVTGSGKTAAFSLPILERLLHRTSGASRALILTPTRELAAQCLGMISSLAQFTSIRVALIVGGSKNLPSQAAELRTRPDIIVATPGRLLDHVTNSAGVTLSDLEFLVLDEADRLLDMGFQDEVMEIVKECPVQRQTLLFSATMNTKVDDLIKLSLKRPVRIRVSDKNANNNTGSGPSAGSNDIEVAPHLEQEFVRIRSGNEGINREAILLALLTRSFISQTIVFFDTKATAHRIMILCGLCGIKCAELHGNLTQAQRLTALESFRNGEVNILLATDLAGRGIDIPNVETVVNFEMPSNTANYIHRIGRTARAGRGGRSCTLIGEGRRHLMKAVIKDAAEKKKQRAEKGRRFKSGTIRSRSIPAAVVAHFVQKIQSLEPHVKEVQQAEAVARLDRLADMEATKAQNLIEHSSEIMSRPQREWFASNKQKKMTKEALAERQAMIREKAGTGIHRMTRKKRRAREAREALAEHDEEEEENTPRPEPEQIMKSAAKAAKRKEQKRDREMAANSLSGKVRTEEGRKKKKRKAGDSAGDSSLFEEEKVVHAKKSSKSEEAAKVIKSSYKFRDDNFDPDNKRKKGKKKSVNSFKSKSKFKRRKK